MVGRFEMRCNHEREMGGTAVVIYPPAPEGRELVR